MNQLFSHTRLPLPIKTSSLFKDAIIAFGWAFLLGIPLFVLFMALFDYEHDKHMRNAYAFIQALADIFPYHLTSFILWLLAIFIAVFAIRRVFQQNVLLIRVQEELGLSHTQGLTDGLTGIWNRSGYEQLFTIAIERGREQSRPFSIILGDVDRLKEYNDTHGHPAADEELKHIAQVMLAQIRATDAVARYGGDEFVIFCFDVNRDEAECLIERLTAALKNAPLTMSYGIASFPIDGDDQKALINVADQRLYRSKAERKSGKPFLPA